MAGLPNTEIVESPAWTRADWIFLWVLLGVTFLCFLPSLGYDFVYDDRLLILNNPAIFTWRSIPGFFLKDFTSVAIPEAPAVYYRPVLLLWMLVNAKLWGIHPAPWHFTAVALHLVVIAEVYVLGRRLLSNRLGASVAAGVFALHPVHVECVAWVMAEAEQLTAALLLASLFAYFRTRDNPLRANAWRGLSLGLFAMALLIKENAIMFPGLIAAYEWFFFEPDGTTFPSGAATPPLVDLWRRVRASLGHASSYIGAAAIYLALRLAVLGSLGHVNTPMSVATYFATLPLVLFRYLKLLLWPVGLSVCYDVPTVQFPDFQNFLIPLITLLLFFILVIAWVRKRREGAFAVVWLILPMLPALDLPVFFRSETVHDRYLYFPSVGFALLVGTLFKWLEARSSEREKHPAWPVAAAALVLGLLAVGTCYARGFWKNNWTLFQRAIQIAPHNVVGLNNLGNEYAERGNCEEALKLYRQVLAEYPPYWESAYNAGFCLYKMGRLEEARGFFQRAFDLEPYDPDVCIYFGMTYFKMGRLDQAESLVRRAIALKPAGRGYHLALGVILSQKGELPEALREFRGELANYPDEAAATAEIQKLSRRTPSPSKDLPSVPHAGHEGKH